MSDIRSRIVGTGSYLPKKVVSNVDLEAVVDTTDDWISSRTGILKRRIAVSESAVDVASKAAERALKASKISAKDIDLIVTGTVTPDMAFPSTSCMVQARLGLRPGIPALDVSAACSGFLYALDLADKYIRLKEAKNVLVIGVDLFSRVVDWTDRSTCVLFGDGAGAAVLKAGRTKSGILSTHLHSDGRHGELLYAPMEIQDNPFLTKKDKNSSKANETPTLKMRGNEIFKIAVRSMNAAIKEVLDHNRLKSEDIALLVPHQANTRIIKAMKERLHLSDDKIFVNIAKYGNTSAASIPIALDEALKQGRIKRGDIVVMAAFGGGLTWGSSAVRW